MEREVRTEYFDNGCVHGAEKAECVICSPAPPVAAESLDSRLIGDVKTAFAECVAWREAREHIRHLINEHECTNSVRAGQLCRAVMAALDGIEKL